MTNEERNPMWLEFSKAAAMCTDPNAQALVIALNAHADLVMLQMQSLESSLTQFGKQLQIVLLNK